MKNNLKFKIILKSFFVLGIFTFFVSALANWSGPSMPMPQGNVAPPVHMGVNLQEKTDGLIVRGFRVLDPTNANTSLSIFDGQIQLKGGTPVLNKILASNDATGTATWKTLAELGGGGGSGMTNPMTTLGDMIYGQVGGVPTRLPIGQPTNILKTTNGIPSWQPAPPSGSNGWTDDGAVVRLTTSTDKVGIGTDIEAPPTEQLTITGNLKVPNSTQNGSQGIIFSANTSGFEEDGRFIHNRGGDSSTYLGERSGNLVYNQVGSGNTGVGFYSIIWGSDGNDNTGLGHHILINTSLGGSNTTVGSSYPGPNSNNTSVGQDSLQFGFNSPCCQVTQDKNAAFGEGALRYDVSLDTPATRHYNVAAGARSSGTNKNGVSDISIGYNAEFGATDLENAAAIGANTTVSASNTMVFGNSSIIGWGFGAQPGGDAIKVGGPGSAGSGARLTQGGAWTDGSDRILKYDISNTKYGLDTILALRPVDYKLKINDEQSIGFIAQEVQEVIPEVVYGKDGEMTMSYGHLTAVLTKAVQELKTENDLLKEMTNILEQEAEKQGY